MKTVIILIALFFSTNSLFAQEKKSFFSNLRYGVDANFSLALLRVDGKNHSKKGLYFDDLSGKTLTLHAEKEFKNMAFGLNIGCFVSTEKSLDKKTILIPTYGIPVHLNYRYKLIDQLSINLKIGKYFVIKEACSELGGANGLFWSSCDGDRWVPKDPSLPISFPQTWTTSYHYNKNLVYNRTKYFCMAELQLMYESKWGIGLHASLLAHFYQTKGRYYAPDATGIDDYTVVDFGNKLEYVLFLNLGLNYRLPTKKKDKE